MVKIPGTRWHVYLQESKNNPEGPEVQNRQIPAGKSYGNQGRLKTARDFTGHWTKSGLTFATTRKNWKTQTLEHEIAKKVQEGDWASIRTAVSNCQQHGRFRIDADLGDGHTLMMRAAEHGQSEIISLIAATNINNVSPESDKQSKADAFNAQNKEGKTALWFAAQNRDIHSFKALLGVEGINPAIADRKNNTILHLAARNGYGELLGCLASLNDPAQKLALQSVMDVPGSDGLTPLHGAINSNCPIGVDALLDLGVDIDKKCKGRSPLATAILKDNQEIWHKLEEREANFRSAYEEVLVDFIMDGGAPEAFEHMLRRYPELIDREIEGPGSNLTLLEFVLLCGRDDLAGVIREREADRLNWKPRAAGNERRHPTSPPPESHKQSKADAGNRDMNSLNALLDEGINPATANRILHLAARNGAGRTLLYLASLDDPAQREALQSVKDVPGNDGLTPLHEAVLSNCPMSVDALLDMGVDVAKRCDKGRSPLATALLKGHREIWQKLEERGAFFGTGDVEALLDVIMEGGSPESFKQMLGRCPQLKDGEVDVPGDTLTILELAKACGRDDLVEVIREIEAEQLKGFCETLGVPTTATKMEVDWAYRTQSRSRHPDKKGGSTEAFQELGVAYEGIKKLRGFN